MRTRIPDAASGIEFARPYGPVSRQPSPAFSPPVPAIAWDPVNKGAMVYATENIYDGMDNHGIPKSGHLRGSKGYSVKRYNLRDLLKHG